MKKDVEELFKKKYALNTSFNYDEDINNILENYKTEEDVSINNLLYDFLITVLDDRKELSLEELLNIGLNPFDVKFLVNDCMLKGYSLSMKECYSVISVIRWEEIGDSMSKAIKEAVNTPEEKERRRKQALELWKNQEYREKVVSARKRLWNSPEYRKKVIKGLKEYANTPEEKERRRKQALELWDSPEYRKRMEKASKKRWENPEYREKVVEGLKEYAKTPEGKKNLSRAAYKSWSVMTSEEKKDRIERRDKGFKKWRKKKSNEEYGVNDYKDYVVRVAESSEWKNYEGKRTKINLFKLFLKRIKKENSIEDFLRILAPERKHSERFNELMSYVKGNAFKLMSIFRNIGKNKELINTCEYLENNNIKMSIDTVFTKKDYDALKKYFDYNRGRHKTKMRNFFASYYIYFAACSLYNEFRDFDEEFLPIIMDSSVDALINTLGWRNHSENYTKNFRKYYARFLRIYKQLEEDGLL